MQYSINPFIHCEGCVKYWCGASQPFTLSIFNIIPLPVSFILHVLCNFLFVTHFFSLILYSSFILLLTFQEGWENGPSLKSLSLMFSVHPYVFDDKYGNKEASCHYYHPPTRKNITWRSNKSQETDFYPFSLLLCSCFQLFFLWNIWACPMFYIQCSAVILLFIIKPWICIHGWKEEALLSQVSKPIRSPA